jgi:hypothetical protein
MANTTNVEVKPARDVYYYRQRFKNRVFSKLSAFFEEEARKRGVTKGDIAKKLDRDPALITRWLREPSNLTLETISDILLGMEAEAEPPEIVRFADRATPNYAHPLVARVTGQKLAPIETSVSTAKVLEVVVGPRS